MRVLKFGGSSLANAERFARVANIILEKKQCDNLAIVLSAPANITNLLVASVKQATCKNDPSVEINKIKTIFNSLFLDLIEIEPKLNIAPLKKSLNESILQLQRYLDGILLLELCPNNIYAKIISAGELLSIQTMQLLLEARSANVVLIDPMLYLVANNDYLDALVEIEASRNKFTKFNLGDHQIGLMPGFIASNKKGELVTLGRNGSDYSAAILAACLNANACEIWTDVDGIYTCDPRVVPEAKLLDSLTYQEAMELSFFGAKVMHPKTIAPIARFKIPCLIKNSFNPQAPGTLISDKCNLDPNNKLIVKGITALKNLSMVNVSGPGMKGMVGMAARIFNAMSVAGISITLITQSSSEYSISFCIDNSTKNEAIEALSNEFSLELKDTLINPIDIQEDLAIISLVGDKMRTARGIAAQFFTSLAEVQVNIVAIAQGSSERSISAVIPMAKISEAVKACHANIFNTNHHLDVFVIGVGGVGSEFIEQIHSQQKKLFDKGIEIKVCAIANSKNTILNPQGIDLNNWQQLLNNSSNKFNLNDLKELVTTNHLINPIIVDCTSSQEIATQYANFLDAGFHVITPNKKANTGSMEYYKQLRCLANRAHRKFMYETTVGAGLPVIENLQNLIAAGDELEQFDGVLSGSLSYIFGKLDEGMSFSQATLLAKENGFTEPDPRDDLSGMDVARKLLILAREAGLNLELKDVVIEPVIPENFDSSGSIDEFLAKIPQADAYFADLVIQAKSDDCVLRYIGQIEDGKCSVKIKAVNSSDPMFKIKDGENALAFYSRFYQPIPLVLRGYGAGTAVTAAGVFADLMRTLGWKLGV